MGSKLGALFSLSIFFLCLLIMTDLIIVQSCYTTLDSVASVVGNMFSMRGGMVAFDEVETYISEQSSSITIEVLNETSIVGEELDFVLTEKINPLFFLNSITEINIQKTAIVGFYSGEIIIQQ